MQWILTRGKDKEKYMELDNFFLAEYDSQNIDHKTVVIELENDSYAKELFR